MLCAFAISVTYAYANSTPPWYGKYNVKRVSSRSINRCLDLLRYLVE